jgi:peptide deformylase
MFLLLLYLQRPSKVRVKAQDLMGKSFMINITGFPARIFQHEYDHLQGKLFCDRMEPQVLEKVRSTLIAMEDTYLTNNPGTLIKRIT